MSHCTALDQYLRLYLRLPQGRRTRNCATTRIVVTNVAEPMASANGRSDKSEHISDTARHIYMHFRFFTTTPSKAFFNFLLTLIIQRRLLQKSWTWSARMNLVA